MLILEVCLTFALILANLSPGVTYEGSAVVLVFHWLLALLSLFGLHPFFQTKLEANDEYSKKKIEEEKGNSPSDYPN